MRKINAAQEKKLFKLMEAAHNYIADLEQDANDDIVMDEDVAQEISNMLDDMGMTIFNSLQV